MLKECILIRVLTYPLRVQCVPNPKPVHSCLLIKIFCLCINLLFGFYDIPLVFEAETWALYQAIQSSIQLQLNHVIFEIDSKMVVLEVHVHLHVLLIN